MPELNDKTMRWIAVAFIILIGIAYFVWLSAVYMKFIETNRRVGAMAEDYYSDKPSTVQSTVVSDDAD